MTLSGIEVQARREALGLTQFDLALALGVSQASVTAWESGKRSVPDGIPDELTALEERLDALIEKMTDAVLTAVEAGQDVPALLVHPGKVAPGPVHDTRGPVLPAALQRVAAARAQFELAAEGVTVRIFPAQPPRA